MPCPTGERTSRVRSHEVTGRVGPRVLQLRPQLRQVVGAEAQRAQAAAQTRAAQARAHRTTAAREARPADRRKAAREAREGCTASDLTLARMRVAHWPSEAPDSASEAAPKA